MDITKIIDELKLRSNENEDYKELLRDKEQSEQFANIMVQVADSFVMDNFDFLAEYSMMYLDQLEEDQEDGGQEFGDDDDAVESMVSSLKNKVDQYSESEEIDGFSNADLENERAMLDYLSNLD